MSFFGGRRQVEPAPAPQQPETPQLSAPAPQPFVGFETVLGANSVMEGTLRSSANVRLDGVFTGTLEITGNILVGETARINADINAKNISVAGAVRGNITGKKVQLLRTGRVWGDIRAQALTTEEGAFIDGKIAMVGQDMPSEPPPFTGSAPADSAPFTNEPAPAASYDANPVTSGADETPAAPAHEGIGDDHPTILLTPSMESVSEADDAAAPADEEGSTPSAGNAVYGDEDAR